MTLLFFAFLLVIYFIKPSWLMILWLISIPFIAPILVNVSGIGTFEDMLNFVQQIWGSFQRAFIVIVFYQMVFKHKSFPKGSSYFLIPCILLCFFYVFHNLVIHPDVATIYTEVAGACYCFLPILVLMMDEKARPSMKAVLWTSAIIIIVQIIMLPLNFEGIIVYPQKYQDQFFFNEELGLLSGTFTQSNALADFLSILFLFWCLDFFLRKKASFVFFSLISALLIVLLALTGSKMPLVLSLLVLVACFFVYGKKYLLPICMGFTVVIIIIVASWSSIVKLGEEYRGVDRFVSGMEDFIGSKKNNQSDNSTMRLSTYLIDQYFHESPIIGCGYSYKGDNAYTLSKDSTFGLGDLKADATFAYHLVEYGIIGLLLILFYYFTLINYAARQALGEKNNEVGIIITSFFIIYSLTEGGIFYRPNMFHIYTYLFAMMRYRKDNQIAI